MGSPPKEGYIWTYNNDVCLNMAAPTTKSKTLLSSISQGDVKVVKSLLSDGANVNERSKDGMAPLSIAAFWGYAEIASVLLEYGADINAQNVGTRWTPLHCAAFQGHGPVILKLMNHRPDLSIKDNRNRTAADFASASDSIWPLFSANGCKRTPKSKLISLGIIEKVSFDPSQELEETSDMSRPQSSYAMRAQIPMLERDPQMEVAAITGDVLAAAPDDSDYSHQRRTHNLLVWDN